MSGAGYGAAPDPEPAAAIDEPAAAVDEPAAAWAPLPEDQAAAPVPASVPAPAAGPPARRGVRTLLDRLLRQPQRFGFDAAVMLLMQAARRRDPGRAVRFHAQVGLSFPAADVLAVQQRPDGFHATVTPIGLTGPSGVLPRPYSEMVVAEQRRRSPALASFLDVLAQRPVALFAEAAIKYRPHRAAAAALLARREREDARAFELGVGLGLDPEPVVPPDPLGALLLALDGFGTPGLLDRLGLEPAPLLHFAGQFATRPRSADRLAALVSDWLGQPVVVEQFAGTWLPLRPEERSALPVTLSNGQAAGSFNQLGVDAAAGTRCWDVQSRIVLRIGPLGLPEFLSLLPSGRRLQHTVALVRAFLGLEIAFAVNPVLARDAVPPLEMGAVEPPRLGWNSWLPVSGVRDAEAGEAVFEADTVEREARAA